MQIALNDFQTFLVVLFVLLGGIATVGKAVDVIKGWRKPAHTLEDRVTATETAITNDDKRLEALEDGQKVICKGILALLSHEINGNSVDKLTASQTEITNYLIDK